MANLGGYRTKITYRGIQLYYSYRSENNAKGYHDTQKECVCVRDIRKGAHSFLFLSSIEESISAFASSLIRSSYLNDEGITAFCGNFFSSSSSFPASYPSIATMEEPAAGRVSE